MCLQWGREGRVGVDIQVLLLLGIDKVVVLDVCELRKFDLGEGVRHARAVVILVAITGGKRKSG